MTDEQIKQRIAYLVEHGGICDDPLNEIRQHVRILFYMTTFACLMGVVGVVELILLIR